MIDKTLDMAREAGGCEYANANPDIESTFILKDDQIKAFEALVRADAIADEREACAKVCEDASGTGKIISCMCAAKAIRGRSNT